MSISPYMSPGLPLTFDSKRAKLIIKLISKETGISVEKISKKYGGHATSYARQLCMYFIRKKTNMSLEDIGNTLGGLDHTTIIAGIKHLEDLMWSDESVSSNVSTLNGLINSLINN